MVSYHIQKSGVLPTSSQLLLLFKTLKGSSSCESGKSPTVWQINSVVFNDDYMKYCVKSVVLMAIKDFHGSRVVVSVVIF